MDSPEIIANDRQIEAAEPLQALAVAAKKTWAERIRENKHGVVAGLRTVSHCLIAASGLGLGNESSPSSIRVIAAVGGLLGNRFLWKYGKRPGKKATDNPDSFAHRHVEKIFYLIMAMVSEGLAVSGFAVQRGTEIIAGLWNMTWASYAAAMPEKSETALEGARTEELSWLKRLVEDYRAKPMKFGTDMMQFSAAFSIVDGAYNRDWSRVISGIAFGGSNLIARRWRDSNFLPGGGIA